MDPVDELIGDSPAIATVKQRVRALLRGQEGARRFPPVLLQGETGTGKGLLARIIHRAGPRSAGPFVDINCAAIPENLLEVELFGYERGAFTDARRPKEGLVQAADGGTLFLDEISLMPAGLQAKLLTVLETQVVRRLGATRTARVNVAVIAATNDDLAAAVGEGRFRHDLYHRLAVVTLNLPALRQRREDIERLADHILATVCAEYGMAPRALSADARAALRAYAWPGNVRELGNVIERAALLATARTITAACLGLTGTSGAVGTIAAQEARGPDGSPRDRLTAALDATGWNITRTAAQLGVTRNTVRAWMRRFGLRAPHPVAAGAEPPPATPGGAHDADADRARTATLHWHRRRVVFLRARLHCEADGWSAVTTRLLDRCIEKVRSFGGRVDEVGRRGLLATFGTEPAEDAPRRAANAALALRSIVARQQGGERPVAVAVDIGVHASRVMIASVGERLEVDQDDRGAVSRALDALEPIGHGQVVLTEAAARLLDRDAELRRRDAPGAPGMVLVAPRAVPAGAFVGRGREIEALMRLLDRALEARGQLVSLVGDAGIGKTRVVREFIQTLSGESVAVREGRCTPYGAQVPYFPVTDLLRAALGVADDAGADALSAATRARLEPLGPDALARAPYVEALLDPRRTTALAPSSPEAFKRRTFEAVRQLLIAQQALTPVVLVFEDVHWIDPTSEQLLSELADVLVGHRVLVVTTSRPGYRLPWAGRSHVTQLSLGPLSDRDSRKLMASLLDTGADEALADTIVSRAAGNPFFLEELARAARSGETPPGSGLPANVADVVAARIDALGDAEREILQLAAVIGPDVPVRLLVEAAARPVGAVREALDRLQFLEFVHATRFDPDAAYGFSHPLTCEAAYESVVGEERGRLHASVARAIERVAPDTGERRPETLARHYAAAGRAHEAVELLHRAGELAVRRSANAEAIAHLERALALVRSAPDDATLAREELRIQGTLAAALAAHRGFGSVELEIVLARIRHLVGRGGLTAALLPVRFGLWRFALSRADFDSVEQLVAELQGTAELHPEPGLAVAAHAAAGTTAFYLGRLAEARRHYEAVAALHDPRRERAATLAYGQDVGIGPLGYLGWTQTLMGDCDRGAATAAHAVALARDSGHPFTIAHALNVAGLVRCDRREPAMVAEYGEEMLAVARDNGFTFLVALALMLVGWARFALGACAEGLALMREGEDRYRGAHQRVGLRARAQLAEALAATGEARQALEVADAALAHARATRDGIYRSEVLRVKGETLIASAGEEAAGLACLEEALAVAGAQGASLLALRAATSLVRIQHARRRPAAEEALRAVLDRFSEGLDLPDLRAARDLLAARA